MLQPSFKSMLALSFLGSIGILCIAYFNEPPAPYPITKFKSPTIRAAAQLSDAQFGAILYIMHTMIDESEQHVDAVTQTQLRMIETELLRHSSTHAGTGANHGKKNVKDMNDWDEEDPLSEAGMDDSWTEKHFIFQTGPKTVHRKIKALLQWQAGTSKALLQFMRAYVDRSMGYARHLSDVMLYFLDFWATVIFEAPHLELNSDSVGATSVGASASARAKAATDNTRYSHSQYVQQQQKQQKPERIPSVVKKNTGVEGEEETLSDILGDGGGVDIGVVLGYNGEVLQSTHTNNTYAHTPI